MSLLLGVHDREAHSVVPEGGWVLDAIALRENPTPTDYRRLAPGRHWIVRLNHGWHPDGTIPRPEEYQAFAQRCAAYVAGSQGCTRWQIGNETNLTSVEAPQGQPITPDDYVRCFRLVREAIKGVQPSAEVIPAPVALWNVESGDWLVYWRNILNMIGPDGCDGLAIHSYMRSNNPADVMSDAKMDMPYTKRFTQFRAYIDLMNRIPANMRHLPAYLTEFNPLPGWENGAVIPAAAQEISAWNAQPETQKILCLILYRFMTYDRWGFSDKPAIIAAFRDAAPRFPAPASTIAAQPPIINLPTVSAGPATLPNRDWDERLTERGVSVQPANVQPGHAYWRVVGGKWFNEQESGGRYHIYARVLDEQGRVVSGVPLRVNWPDGEHRLVTEDKPSAEWVYPANFPMGRSLSEFSIRVDDGSPSEIVSGIGRGADGNVNIHTSTLITFQRATQPGPPPPPNTVNIPAVTVGQTMYTNAPAGLFVRGGPGATYGVVTKLPHGTRVEVTATIGEWSRIASGWVHGAWLSATQPAPVVEPGPVEPVQPSGDKWERSYAFTARWEGGFQNHHNDKGNWTGGQVGKGELKGTNWGISAASYPHLDIRNLTKEQAKAIYFRDYWQASGADKLDWPGCLIVFDTAVLHGVGRARQWVQEAGTNPLHFAARRLRSYVVLDNWHFWGAAWTRRVADLLEESAR